MQINPNQILIEKWEVKFERALHYGEHRCHIYFNHPVIVASGGHGKSVEAARINALVKMAAGYIGCSDLENDWNVSDEALEYMAKAVRGEQNRRKKAAKAAGK